MTFLSRRNFVKMLGAASVACAFLALPAGGAGRAKRLPKVVRVKPHPSATISPADAEYFGHARFSTAADAMRATARRGVAAVIYRG